MILFYPLPIYLPSLPVVRTEAVLNNGGNFAPIALLGVDPKKEAKVIDIERFLSVKLDALNTDSENEYSVILGEECARRLNLLAGDSVKVDFVKCP